MRATTTIVAAIILALFILSIGGIIVISFIEPKRDNLHTEFNQHNKSELTVKPFKIAVLTYDLLDNESNSALYGILTVQQLNDSDADSGKVIFPQELSRFITVETVGDTLFIRAKNKELKENFYNERQGIYFTPLGANFELYTDCINIINEIKDIDIAVNNADIDSIKVNTIGRLMVDNCNVDVFEPILYTSYRLMNLSNSRITKLNMNLDLMGKWNVENCIIDEGNFTGSGNKNIYTSKKDFKTINWLPKDEESKLELTLLGNQPARIVFAQHELENR